MTIPDFLSQPERPPVPSRGAIPPFIINNQRGADGVVYVTWALPGLRRAIVAVPEASWLNGEHNAAGMIIAQLVERWSPVTRHDRT